MAGAKAAKSKLAGTVGLLVGIIAVTACDAGPVDAASTAQPTDPSQSRQPTPAVKEALAAQDAVQADERISAETLRRFGDYQYHSGDWRPTLSQFARWVEQAGGYSRFGVDEETGNVVVFMQLTWTYEDGSAADYGFVLVPNPRTREAAVMQAYRGEERMRAAEADDILSGIVLDMYHLGMLPPG